MGFAQPQDGQVFDAGVDLDVVVDASDPDGGIANVKLYLNGQFVRQEKVFPYEWPSSQDPVFRNMAAGSYDLTAVATDNLGPLAKLLSASRSMMPPIRTTHPWPCSS